MNVQLSDFIYIRHNALTPEFCQHVIDKFENDDRPYQGMVGRNEDRRVDTSIKDSMDLLISSLPEWKEEDKIFFESLNHHVQEYLKAEWLKEIPSLYFDNPTDSGYQIQRTSPGSGYSWHQDEQNGEYVIENGCRWSTYIWYLNDVEEDGYTEFCDGTKIQPETGKIVIFPSSWPYFHRGYPPKSELKYIVTGWMHTR